MLVRCYHEAGVPEDAVRLVLGGPDEGKALAAHPDVGGVLFTGSAQTGIAINRQFAANPGKLLALEMGDRKSVVEGKSVSVRVDLGGRRLIKKNKKTKHT